jgi:DNA-binding NtrC family response regulator
LTIDVAASTARVGTARDNEMVLTDDLVSMRHCEIEPTPDGIRIRDTGSTSGVFAGSVRIFDAMLTAPLVLRIGKTRLSIATLDDTILRMRTAADRFGDVLGRSTRIQELFADLERIAGTDLSVLIEGEPGTGKDLIAESIHRASSRSEHPCVVFHAGAVAPALIESELFGQERTALKGGPRTCPGVFERANGGTVVLTEIGELPREHQAKLMRPLERGEIRRVGATQTIPIDVRLVASTHRNILAEVQRGRFRQDLYLRIAGAHITVPSLRDRMEDLPVLVQHFLGLAEVPRSVEEIRPEIWNMFLDHRWPGNVRELRDAVRRLLVLPERARQWAGGLHPGDDAVFAAVPAANVSPLRLARQDARDSFERLYVSAALARAEGNVTRAARMSAVSRQSMTKLIRKHGLQNRRGA